MKHTNFIFGVRSTPTTNPELLADVRQALESFQGADRVEVVFNPLEIEIKVSVSVDGFEHADKLFRRIANRLLKFSKTNGLVIGSTTSTLSDLLD